MNDTCGRMHVTEKRVLLDELIHITEHQHLYVNPYNGCSEDCPYCYWKDIPGWDGHLEVRLNAAELLDSYLMQEGPDRLIYIGSCCNPYDYVEERYRITRSMLEVLEKRGNPFVLMTSSNRILDDLELLRKIKKQAILVFELSRIERMKEFAITGRNEVIEAANHLDKEGFCVMTTLSPYLEGITDLDAVLAMLNEGIPVYVGLLDVKKDSPMAERFMKRIKKEYPNLVHYYQNLIEKELVAEEYQKRFAYYSEIQQVKSFPLQIPFKN